jgi:hypothetical protein
MAGAPGLGIGDIVAACNYIYTKCSQFREAPAEFDEIKEKSKATQVVLIRLRREADRPGNLVERAEKEAPEA